MKKKILATLLAGALAVTSAIGFSACNSGGIPKGDEVTKEEWVNAFANTGSVQNYTLEGSVSIDVTVKGTVTVNDGSYIDPNTGEYKVNTKEVTTRANTETSSSFTVLYDKEGRKAYLETSAALKASGEEDGEKESVSSKNVLKEYYELNDSYWRARYSLTESSSSDSDGETDNFVESYWTASQAVFLSNPITQYMFGETSFYESNVLSATPKNVSQLYDNFEYSGGKYSATLYQKVDLYKGIYQFIECTVTLSFNKAENCVIGLSIKCDGDGTISQLKTNYKYTYEGESVYSLTKINSTDVSKKVNKDITKAIDKAKGDND